MNTKKVALIVFIIIILIGTSVLINNRNKATVEAPTADMSEATTDDGAALSGSATTSSPAKKPTGSTSTTANGGSRVEAAKDTTLAVGKSDTVDGLPITFKMVQSDSRCPVDVKCVQAGSLSVIVALGEEKTNITLTSGKTTTYKGYKLSIGEILPVKESKEVYTDSDYHVTFHIAPTATGSTI